MASEPTSILGRAGAQDALPGRVIARLARLLEVALVEADLSPSQYRLMARLALGPSGASGLAGNLAISKPSLTGVVDGLVARALVDRREDENDRRRVALTLTAEGRAALESADRVLERTFAEILAYGSDEAAVVAHQGLTAWQQALDAHRNAVEGER
jgi:DNA-binding MarR family transcriptional regulator